MSDESRICPKCGGELPAAAPAGVCPRCVFALGLGDGVSEPAPTSAPPGGFEPPAPEELSGKLPQLEIVELLGHGGMGAVYRARQTHLDREVAVKILPPEIGRDAAFVERFAREARALARLSHPNIVSIFDFGQAEGYCYLVMEFVDGVNLREAIGAGSLSPPQALAIVPPICDALQYAHDRGIVHRDIKPENIMLDQGGAVKIADFGLAKLAQRPGGDVSLTVTNQVMGTMHYMAPEQIETPLKVDHRADIYSLGVVLYELLVGELPLGRFDLPSRRVQIDVRLDEVVLKTLEREPDRRYQKISEVKTDVESIRDRPQPADASAVPARYSPQGETEEQRREAALRAVNGPGIATIVVGGLHLLPLVLFCLFCGLFVPWVWVKSAANQAGHPALAAAATPVFAQGFGLGLAEFAIVALLLLVYAPTGLVLILAGLKMRKLEGYPLAIVGAILGMLPISPFLVVGLPVGVWSLVVLLRNDVKEEFDRPPPDDAQGSPLGKSP